jgi:hypothetical protein
VSVYATLDDLIARFPRDLTSEEEVAAETLLQDASFWLAVWVPGLDAAVSGGDEVLTEAAKLLVVAMVRRNLTTPQQDDGIQSLTTGKFQVAYRTPDSSLYLYGRELEDITSLLRSSRAAAVSYRSPGL